MGACCGLLVAAIFERIHHSLFQSYFLKMSEVEATLQYFEDADAKIFCSRHNFSEFFPHIQILEVKAGEHFPFNKTVEVHKVADHASSGVYRTADGHFKGIVVSVAVRIVALAVDGAVLGLRHIFAVQAMRSGKAVAAGEMSNHAVVSTQLSVVGSEFTSFVSAHASP